MENVNVIKSQFSVSESPWFNGYTSGILWNGWSCPSFELDEAKKVCKWMENYCGEKMYYDEANDRIMHEPSNYEDVIKEYGIDELAIYPIEVSHEGRTIKTYPIGFMAWCWEDAHNYDMNNYRS